MDAFTTTDLAENGRRKRRRGLLAILLASSLATLGAGSLSLAVFSATDTSTGNWSTGSIKLEVTDEVSFNVSGILPGDTGQQTINVDNTGTGDLRYAMTTAISNNTNGLGAQMQLEVEAGACGSTTGTLYAEASMAAAAFGNPATGQDGGDRLLDAGDNEDLCFSWRFPLASDSSYAEATTTATFTFAAEQTKNN
jgi:hypothetical protein